MTAPTVTMIALALVACASPKPLPQPPPPAPMPAAIPAVAAKPPAAPVFAETDPGYAFLDPDRKTKLVAAVPKIEAAIAEEVKRQELPGIAIGIVIDGELVYEKDADTVYRIGSISKSFTGLAILSLRDDGALDLDDPITKWIPEAAGLVYPTRDARPITLRQLLTHTSGLPRMGPFDNDHNPDEAAVLKSLAGLRLESAPGTQHVYSNLGFSLLGIVAAHAGKMPLHELVKTRIWAPLGMTSTYWDQVDVPKGKLAQAYKRAPGPPQPTEPIRLGAADGAGGIYSTVRDMARYAALQLSAYPPRNAPDDGPIKRATLREAHSTGVFIGGSAGTHLAPKPGDYLVDFNARGYGNGWVAEENCLLDDIVWHNGAIDSYHSVLAFLKERGVGVVALTNMPRGQPEPFAGIVEAELAKTGALAKRVMRPAPAFDAATKSFLAVYNQWDEAAYKAMLDPARGPVPEEKDELAGYKALHGACTSATPVEVAAPMRARFKFACERGALVMEMSLAANGLIDGFFGESRDVTAPPDMAKTGAALTALMAKWDEKAYVKALPKAAIKPADAKKVFDDLHAQHGACKVTAPVHEGFDWRFELACERNGNLVLNLQQDPKDKTVTGFGVRLLMDPDSRCPKR